MNKTSTRVQKNKQKHTTFPFGTNSGGKNHFQTVERAGGDGVTSVQAQA